MEDYLKWVDVFSEFPCRARLRLGFAREVVEALAQFCERHISPSSAIGVWGGVSFLQSGGLGVGVRSGTRRME